ncbi:MAG: SusC/RagA family TonB-linked outer membrane protein, partial [Cytophagales bacterium]|nr:SusC/RagA family TonB-linked outer membrane protein [Cytophagales bacterium]
MKKRYIGLLILLTSTFTVPLVAQDTTVTGNVTDESGEALPGVSVLIVGTSTGTVTDLDGNFNLAVNDASTAILEFSFVGFKTVRENVQGRTSFNIVLRQDILGLDEIVVIGSSVTSTRKELGNAISTVKSDELTKATPQSLFNGLQGKIAGAQITQNSGDPAGGFSVRLRGPSTISGSSEPLYIIDGVVLDNSTTNVTNTSIDERDAQVGQNRMADINPNDIERLEVINGAAAAAIYGSRASNGVILITTKKGEAGAPQYSFSSSFNINELRKEVPTNRFPVIIGSPEQRLFPLLNPLSNEEFPVTRYDYQDQIFDTGFGTDNYLSARGGTENTTYFTSLAYMRNEGIIQNTDFRRISAKLSLTQRLRDDLKINFGINYINSFSNEKPDGNVFYSPINSINITNNIYNIEERDQFGNLLAVEPTRINPLTIIEEYDITQETNRVIGNFQATYTPVAGLTIDYLFGLDSYNQEGNTYLAPVPYDGVNIAFFPDGYASVANVNNFQLNSDINISYFKHLSNSITSNTTVGYNFQYSQGLFTLSQGRRLTPNVSNVAGANIILEPRRTDVRQRIWGWFVQETLGWDEKLFLTLAGRIDGSTVFSEDNRNNFYPKI